MALLEGYMKKEEGTFHLPWLANCASFLLTMLLEELRITRPILCFFALFFLSSLDDTFDFTGDFSDATVSSEPRPKVRESVRA